MKCQRCRIAVISAALTLAPMLPDEFEFAFSAPDLLFFIVLVAGVRGSVLTGPTAVLGLPTFQDFAAHDALH